MATSQFWAYPKREQAIFDAFMSACGNGLLISECQDFLMALKSCGYVLRPMKNRRAAKPAPNSSSHKMPSYAYFTKGIHFMTVGEGSKAFEVYTRIARHFGH